jgi:Zn-finger nucleic acid-binding protein
MPACPVCSTNMKEELRSEVPVDVCATHGIWLDKKELFLITEHERHEHAGFMWADLFRKEVAPPKSPGRTLGCPHCAVAMKRELYEEVELDWCHEHGIWLDNGELEAILSNLRLDESYLRGWRLRLWETRY